jgi:glycosyltransferase involved in cell wall biosynthesis
LGIDPKQILIVIPVLNEVSNIGSVLDAVVTDNPDTPIQVWDGGSADGTQRIVREVAAKSPNVELFDNPLIWQSAAVNQAASRGVSMGCKYLVRLDAHAIYPPDFVAKVIACLNEHKADSVTVPLVANMGNGLVQSAICELQNTYLGHGGSPHSKIGRSGWTNHGHHAAFLLRSFVAVGGYDTGFEANEDYELDVRLRVAGKRIFQLVDAPVSYFPRATVLGLARQMFRNGQGRAKTALKHGQPPGLRQLLPVLATIFILSALAVAMFSPEL